MAIDSSPEWWKEASDVIKSFHDEKAAIPSNTQRAREDLKENIAFLRTYLEFNYNLCDKVIFSGIPASFSDIPTFFAVKYFEWDSSCKYFILLYFLFIFEGAFYIYIFQVALLKI